MSVQVYPSGWEVDWSDNRYTESEGGARTRREKEVMARNPRSVNPRSRAWRYVRAQNVKRSVGNIPDGVYPEYAERKIKDGYVFLSLDLLTLDQRELVDRLGLITSKHSRVAEHRLVAAETYGDWYDPRAMVVRHKNGNKTDNRPENLLIGTNEENMMDHETARKAAMFWHQKCRELERENAALRAGQLPDQAGGHPYGRQG